MPDLGSLGDVIVAALEAFLRGLFTPVKVVVETQGNNLVELVVGTPYPNVIYTAPSNGPWPAIYDYYWDAIVPLSLFIWAMSVGLVIFFESTSHLFSSYHRTKLKKRAFSGLLGILGWWWMAALSLRFVSALATVIVPELSTISLFESVSIGTMGVFGLVVGRTVSFTLFALIGLIYLVRELVLYLFVLLLPILIALWIPGVGPFTHVSRFVRRLAGFYVPFLFMTVPVAIIFRLGELLGSSLDPSMGGVGAWLVGLVLPLLAVLSPIVLVWQAGAVFFIADRASRHVSRERARRRTARVRETGAATVQGGRNFVRGVQDNPAIDRDGQTYLGHGGSRAHAAGSRLSATTTRLRTVFDGGERGTGGSGGSGGSGGTTGTDGADGTTGDGQGYSRTNDFETLRDRGGSESRDGADDNPRYIY